MTCYTFDLGDGDTASASFDHEPSLEDLSAVRDVALAAKRQEEERRAALSPEHRAAEDDRQARARVYIESLRDGSTAAERAAKLAALRAAEPEPGLDIQRRGLDTCTEHQEKP